MYRRRDNLLNRTSVHKYIGKRLRNGFASRISKRLPQQRLKYQNIRVPHTSLFNPTAEGHCFHALQIMSLVFDKPINVFTVCTMSVNGFFFHRKRVLLGNNQSMENGNYIDCLHRKIVEWVMTNTNKVQSIYWSFSRQYIFFSATVILYAQRFST